MQLRVDRTIHNQTETIGELFIDGVFQCYTLEDPHNDIKVWGNTRIPAGTYKLELRTEGSKHVQYKKKYPDIHKGMLHVLNVPNFKWILIHVGNTNVDTHGCLLVGLGKTKTSITQSVLAYKKIYPIIAEALEKGEDVMITYNDL